MSDTQSQTLPAQPDAAQISSLVSSIVSKARKGGSLSSLTPRLVRSEVENRLEIPSGTLDSPVYRALVKQTIHDAMDKCEQASREGGIMGKKIKKGSKLKVNTIGHPSSSKSIKSKEIITDSEREDGPNLSTLQRKTKPDMKVDNHEEERPVRSNKKIVSSKADPKTNKDNSRSIKAEQLGSKRKLSPQHIAQSDADADGSNAMPKVSSSSRRVTDNQESDSDLSSLVDEPSKKRARGKSKSLVVACGVRKQWTRELDGLNTGSQIAHIRKILDDLGMVGRLSMEQAREIRAQRELAQELDDVQKFERAIVSDPGSESASADHEPPKMNNARRSIMAFLQDQSSDDD
ncbi:hypothetical protein BJV77DRAFT_1072714 [Russula vinacea]|nr:hypothetical protein BJV77DRAFT_1072714 [Russula vinacea]